MKCLLVIDMQNDFLTGALGTPEGAGIVGNVCGLIRGFDGKVIYTGIPTGKIISIRGKDRNCRYLTVSGERTAGRSAKRYRSGSVHRIAS